MANSSTFNGKLEPSLQISDPHTGSAKDDNVTLSPTNTFTLDDILGNDPGSAIFQPGSIVVTGAPGSGIYYDADLGIFHVTGNVTSFDYMIQMANGSYSTATVTLDGGAGAAAGVIRFEETFDGYTEAMPWGYGDLSTNGWTGTTNAEIVQDGYQTVLVGTDPDADWLDTQGSPGAINITHDVVDDGGNALISFTAAYQEFVSDSVSYVTGDTLEFVWNGAVVMTISAAGFPEANQFLDFSVVVDSESDGDNTLQIRDTAGLEYVGFALDSVTVNDWIIV